MVNTDRLRERLRERILEPDDEYHAGHCLNCNAQLTKADVELGECSQCHSSLEIDDENLVDDYDWYNANGLLDDG